MPIKPGSKISRQTQLANARAAKNNPKAKEKRRANEGNKENESPISTAVREANKRAEREKLRANREKARADQERARAEQAEEKLKQAKREAKNARNREKRLRKAKADWLRKESEAQEKVNAAYNQAEARVRTAVLDGSRNLKKLEKELEQATAKLKEAHTDIDGFKALSYEHKTDLMVLRKTVRNLQRTAARRVCSVSVFWKRVMSDVF
ncbi:hypothetical protein BDZ89DRAFT_1150158 [Hymenopellis radicata]|nr:hypothetical protein BDZ89DRAFT_1150158 [Hymenopellis radicata]